MNERYFVGLSRDEIIDIYVKFLARVVGNEEKARMKLYSVSTKYYFGFGANLSLLEAYKIRFVPGVSLLQDSYKNKEKKEYGGEPVINGVPLPYDPKYHSEYEEKKTIIKEKSDDGLDFQHWRVLMNKDYCVGLSRDEIVHQYVITLAEVVGSEGEARMKLYSVSTKYCYYFSANISEEVSSKLKEVNGVRKVLPDSYVNIENKEYRGEPVINGVPVPYDPKYHARVHSNYRANNHIRSTIYFL